METSNTWLLGLGVIGVGLYLLMNRSASNLMVILNPALEPTADQLATAANTSVSLAANALDSVIQGARAANINTVDRWSMWISQTAHETGGYRLMREGWGPTDAQKRYEPGTSLAARLGNTEVGDGFRFRGRGLIQITGRANYQKAGDDLGLDLINDPDQAAISPGAGLIAAWYWNTHNLNSYADNQDVEGATKVINGGLNGIDDRQARYASAQSVMADIASGGQVVS